MRRNLPCSRVASVVCGSPHAERLTVPRGPRGYSMSATLGQGEVGPAICRVRNQLLERGSHALLQVDAVVLRHVAGKREVLQVAPHAHAHGGVAEAKRGQVELAAGRQALHLGQIPVVHVLELTLDAMVVADHLVEVGLELIVVSGAHSVEAHAGVGVLVAALAAQQQELLLVSGQRLEVYVAEVLGHK
eukprot:1186240-Prorocentrum_minimum.AAC.1